MVLCGSDKTLPIQYQSIGRSITLSFVFNHNYDYAFLLESAAVRKTLVHLAVQPQLMTYFDS